MSSCNHPNKRFTPPARAHKATHPAVRPVNRSSPGFLSAGTYTMLFSCNPELCSCATSSHTHQEQTALPGDVHSLNVSIFAASRAAGGVQPWMNASTGGVYLTPGAGPDHDIIIEWELPLVLAILAEIEAVPTADCMLAVGHPTMRDFILLTHEASRAFTLLLRMQARVESFLATLPGTVKVDGDEFLRSWL